jgi:mannose-1-phosphate guanylyltransferase
MTTAMVLAAGFGTRLRPLTDELPKALMPIGDRSALAHTVAALRQGGVDGIVMNAHHLADDFFSEVMRLRANLNVVRESEILGTAGGVANAGALLGAGDALIWNGDISAPDLDVAKLIEGHPGDGADARWVVEPLGAGEGTVGLDEAGHVVRLRAETFGQEVVGGNFLGIQIMSANLRAGLPLRGCLVADVALPLLRRGGRIASFAYRGAWDDIGHPGALLRSNLRWLARHGLPSWRGPGAEVKGMVGLTRSLVGAGAVVGGTGELRDCVVFPGAELNAPSARILAARRGRVQVADEGQASSEGAEK